MRPFLVLIVFLLFPPFSPAQEKTGEDKPAEKKEKPLPKAVTREGSVMIGGQEVAYKVTAATISLPDEEDSTKERARVFYQAYIAEPRKGQPSNRPIAFCFNGGPGSSSVWLHLGGLGPRRVKLDEAGTGVTLAKPPYGLVDNEHSILDLCDLVFIDPVSTGFSRPEDSKDAKQFHGLEGDIESVGAFIHQYCSKNGRWDSAKYLIGESYGGIRAAGLVNHLQDRYGMYLNGIVLVSALLDFGTLLNHEGNDNPYLLFLPALANTANYHKKAPGANPDAVYREALAFAYGDYADALLAGSALPDAQRQAVATRLAALTGIPRDEFLRANLRLDESIFRKLLLRAEGKSVGRFDSRVIGIDPDKAAQYPDYDASYAVVYGPFASAFNHYLREEIGFESEDTYEILTGNVQPWNYTPFTNRYVNMNQRLTEAMTNNPHLKVFVALGYYDLATPPAAIEYSLNHLRIDPSLRPNIVTAYYEGGHMMYTNLSALAKLKTDLAAFMK